jgi:hypothetical protein
MSTGASANPAESSVVSKTHKPGTIRESPALDAAGVYGKLNSRPKGSTADEATVRLTQCGPKLLAIASLAFLGSDPCMVIP